MKARFKKFLDNLSRDEMKSITGGYDHCSNCYSNAYDACYNHGHVPDPNECMDNQAAECDRVFGC